MLESLRRERLKKAHFHAFLRFIGIATVGRLWCFLYIAGYKTNHLVTEGPYSLSRNPLYFFSLIGFVGVGLSSETLFLPALLLLAFISYYPAIILREEKRLMHMYPDVYTKYVKSTPRFFPVGGKFREAEKYIVKPKVFRRQLFDALLFVWCAGILELMEELRQLGWIPELFKIY